jgi:putative ABC transport system permease protein
METLLRNVRYAIRGLTRTPGFTITVVATLALGIGANTAVFSGVDAILLQPLTFPNPDTLVLVTETRESAPISNTAPVRIEEWNAESTTFEAITGYYTEDVSETSGDLPQRFRLARVAPRFVDVWGVAPALGRGFTPEESQEGAASVVVVSHRFWQTQLEGDPNVLERQLRLGDEEFSVIGVMPESFRFPDRDVDLWAPRIYFAWMLSNDARFNLWYSGYGRLKPGVSLAQARADLAAVQTRLAEQYPETDRDVGVYIEPLKETAVGGVRQSLWLLFGSVSVLLLIASTNIAALLLSRTAERRQEFAIRFSLGAPRWSVVVQTLTETAVLTVAGAALGVGVAQAGSAAFRAFVPDLPRVDEVGLDGRILVYALLTIVTVTVLCGLLPAIRGVREGSSAVIAEGRRTQVSARHSLQWLFVGVQVALSIVLLAGAGLLIRSFMELTRVDPGFEPNRVLSFRVSGAYEDFEGLASNVDVILDELRTLPGVEAVATSSPVPGVLDDGSGFQFGTAEYELEGRGATEPRVLSEIRIVSPSYFPTMQIPLLLGELCRVQSTDAPMEMMVNRSFAARYLGTSPVGRRLRGGGQEYRVAGVVGDARE